MPNAPLAPVRRRPGFPNAPLAPVRHRPGSPRVAKPAHAQTEPGLRVPPQSHEPRTPTGALRDASPKKVTQACEDHRRRGGSGTRKRAATRTDRIGRPTRKTPALEPTSEAPWRIRASPARARAQCEAARGLGPDAPARACRTSGHRCGRASSKVRHRGDALSSLKRDRRRDHHEYAEHQLKARQAPQPVDVGDGARAPRPSTNDL